MTSSKVAATTKESLYKAISAEIDSIKAANTYKQEVFVEGFQGPTVSVDGKNTVMLASNNYLGLSNHPRIHKAAKAALDKYGFGMSSVRFICGAQPIHRQLEEKIASFVGCEDAILHSSCYAANEAFFTAIVANEFPSLKAGADYRDVLYSDQLNHASIIDGVRLARIATKTTDGRAYPHNNMVELERFFKEDDTKNYRLKILVTDGVFSMEGDIVPLPKLIELCNQHQVLLYMDDSHSTGVLGATGRGTAEHYNLVGKVDVISGTFGKALGGASGGFIAGKKELVDFLRQKSRPYTFSNTMPPPIVAASLEAIHILEEDPSLVEKLHANTAYFRKEIVNLGFKILEGSHPIVPVMLGEASIAQDMSKVLLEHGVFVRGLWYPVVPKGEARLRVQISGAHTKEHLDRALSAFATVGKKLCVLS
jgi:glycine C-acetyltransferase